MSKNASIIILNELKKKRDEVEKKYQKQRNKKISKLGISLYTLAFLATTTIPIILLPEISMALVGGLALAYNLIVPFTYFGIEASKEIKLENELKKYNKKIDRLELEINGIQVNHHYISSPESYLVSENEMVYKKNNVNQMVSENNNGYIQEECGPVLKRKF